MLPPLVVVLAEASPLVVVVPPLVVVSPMVVVLRLSLIHI